MRIPINKAFRVDLKPASDGASAIGRMRMKTVWPSFRRNAAIDPEIEHPKEFGNMATNTGDYTRFRTKLGDAPKSENTPMSVRGFRFAQSVVLDRHH